MSGKGEMSRRKAWIFVLIMLLDDAAILALIVLGLWFFDVKISWILILIVGLAMVGFIFVVHKAVVPSLRRKKATGIEYMIGLGGKVTESLQPQGLVMIKGEYWKAKSVEGDIGVGEEVEVVRIIRLSLEVRRKTS